MPTFLFEASYTSEAWSNQLKKPTNRIQAVHPIVEKAGGRIVSAYYAFGETDLIVIAELPDNQAAAALSMAFAAGGALSKCNVTVLIEIEEGIEAIKQSGELVGVYTPPDQ